MRDARPDGHAQEWKIWAALIVVYVIWGSTYLAIRVVVETMPPLLTGATRFATAGLIIFGLLLLRRGAAALRLERNEWIGAGLVGLALLLGGNGLVVLGERDVPSALAALIIAVEPLVVVLLRRLFGERIQRGTIIGVVAGFAGVAVLIVPRGVSGDVSLFGMLLIVGAAFSWAIGSYFSKRVALPRDPLASTAAQMLVGSAGLLAAGLLTGEMGLVHLDRFSSESILALLYLLIFGSLVAYTAYTWLLVHASVSRVSTYAYVNPVVAIFLGSLLLRETIDLSIIVGALMIVVSVGLVIRTESRRAQPSGAPDESAAPSQVIATVEGVDDAPAADEALPPPA